MLYKSEIYNCDADSVRMDMSECRTRDFKQEILTHL